MLHVSPLLSDAGRDDVGDRYSAGMSKVDYLTRLKAAYRNHAGIDVVSGLNPYHFGNFRDAPFARFLRHGENLTSDLGISLWELLFLERVCRAQAPRSIFIVGNGQGWSAIALAMMNPDAFVVVVEPQTGIELTNRIAFRERLGCIDFDATFALAGRKTIYFFHDIVNFNLFAGLSKISEVGSAHAMTTNLLFCTPSGMAVVTPNDAPQAVHDAIRLFSVSAQEMMATGKASNSAVSEAWLVHARS
jgi:hypothetical protein